MRDATTNPGHATNDTADVTSSGSLSKQFDSTRVARPCAPWCVYQHEAERDGDDHSCFGESREVALSLHPMIAWRDLERRVEPEVATVYASYGTTLGTHVHVGRSDDAGMQLTVREAVALVIGLQATLRELDAVGAAVGSGGGAR